MAFASLKTVLDIFPLHQYSQPSSPYRLPVSTKPTLWIGPALGEEVSPSYPWASSDPRSFRYQLLLLLAGVEYDSKDWENEEAAPEGTLPAVVLPSGKLVPLSGVRTWLDREHPFYPSSAPHHGYPSQALESQARAFGRLVEDKLSLAIIASDPTPANLLRLTPLLSNPPPLLAGFASPFPSLSTSTLRRFDLDSYKRQGVEAIKALAVRLKEDHDGRGWFLGCSKPTPLDCLIVSHLFVALNALNPANPLRRAIEADKVLKDYVERLLKKLSPSLGEDQQEEKS
ncbi:hypothetical protein BDY24DRAFT_150898 [Mrakia frigida]|uniref:glutathione S-transferase family protein n=1 Tax=Mrakia frigida TaxID=29902 RepID=UPI003FCC0FDF